MKRRGQMKAVDPDEAGHTPYFRFSNQPAWLMTMQERIGRESRSGNWLDRPQPRRRH